MNIPVLTASGKVIVRPDTTWKRDDDSCWMPDFVDRLFWSPVAFARITKLGKGISAKFAPRYYDSVGFGFLLYPENMIDGSPEGFACASCLDHTTFLSYPTVWKPEDLICNCGDEAPTMRVLADGEEIFRCMPPSADVYAKAIETVTRICRVRSGDLLAIELQERAPLCSRPCPPLTLESALADDRLTSVQIVL